MNPTDGGFGLRQELRSTLAQLGQSRRTGLIFSTLFQPRIVQDRIML